MIAWLVLLQAVTLPPQLPLQPEATLRDQSCSTVECRRRATAARYRLLADAPRIDDPVARAMRAGDWSRCGRSGMPVCPSKRHVLFNRPFGALLGGR